MQITEETHSQEKYFPNTLQRRFASKLKLQSILPMTSLLNRWNTSIQKHTKTLHDAASLKSELERR